MLVSMTDGDLADRDARLGSSAPECLPSHGDQAQAIAATLLVLAAAALVATKLFPAACNV